MLTYFIHFPYIPFVAPRLAFALLALCTSDIHCIRISSSHTPRLIIHRIPLIFTIPSFDFARNDPQHLIELDLPLFSSSYHILSTGVYNETCLRNGADTTHYRTTSS